MTIPWRNFGLLLIISAGLGTIACTSHDPVGDAGAAGNNPGGAASGEGGTSDGAGVAGSANPAAGSSQLGVGAAGAGALLGAAGASEVLIGVAGSGAYDAAWFADNTISQRNSISLPGAATNLSAEQIVTQLKVYDPGSLLRCAIHDDPAYRAVVDAVGGVTWGYQVNVLQDESKPQFMAGFPRMYSMVTAGNAADSSSAVEIEEADIVGISENSALFYSNEHGLFLVDLSGATPAFNCATKLPGRVSKFFYYQGHLVVMTESQSYGIEHRSYLLHFDITGGTIQFIESVDLGRGSILDTRRFNDRLVVYTDLTLEAPTTTDSTTTNVYRSEPMGTHRTLRVFTFGDTLTEQMNQTLLDTTPSQAFLTGGGIPEDTAPGTQVSESSSFGRAMWASDHYFVVTEAVTKTTLASWITRTYPICVKSHIVEEPYTHCDTIYETRPNPNYTPPDNSGGDRACNGTTLADCLRAVSRASNPTLQVPVGKTCATRVRSRWVCDEQQTGSYTYPQLTNNNTTRLYIYEYTDQGFVRLDTKVSEISTPGLDAKTLDDAVPTLTTSADVFDLAVPGVLQTLYFQNGFLYAIADGTLQVYAMGDSSMVRTSSLQVVNNGLQTSLFANDRIYLSDFGYSSGRDQSVLRVIDLTNPAFPSKASQDRTLPGGHSNILPTSRGILTIGSVANFEPGIQSVLKLGLFTDPFASELAYLILGTDLGRNYLGDAKAHYFDSTAERLFLPYYGYARDSERLTARVGVSHLETSSIASEGAVELPELPMRVRPKPGSATDVLAFSRSTVEWLRPGNGDWAATPLLEYWKPIALYRLSEQDDYIQILNLGNRCKLQFATPSNINSRPEASISPAFDCNGSWPWAYGNNIIFNTSSGVQFATTGEVKSLTSDEIAALTALRQARPICVFSQQRLDNTQIDYTNPPDVSDLQCYSPQAYQTANNAIPEQ